MAGLNKVFLMGNLTRDPEVRYIPSGTAVAEFGIAINRTYKSKTGESKEDTLFVNIVAWDRRAEFAGEYLKKGRKILVEGRLQLDEWEKDGVKHSRMKVVAESIHFADSRPREENVGGNEKELAEEPKQETSTKTENSTEDDLPF